MTIHENITEWRPYPGWSNGIAGVLFVVVMNGIIFGQWLIITLGGIDILDSVAMLVRLKLTAMAYPWVIGIIVGILAFVVRCIPLLGQVTTALCCLWLASIEIIDLYKIDTTTLLAMRLAIAGGVSYLIGFTAELWALVGSWLCSVMIIKPKHKQNPSAK